MNRKMTITLAIAAGIASMVTTTGLAQQGDTVIKLAFVIRSDHTAPRNEPGHNAGYNGTLVLSGNNRVQEHWEARSATGTDGRYHADDSSVGSRWKVVSPNTISASWPQVTWVKTITVHVSGKSCSITFSANLMSGQNEYRTRYHGTVWTSSKPLMIDPSCTIQ
jgi:hypothetical protein